MPSLSRNLEIVGESAARVEQVSIRARASCIPAMTDAPLAARPLASLGFARRRQDSGRYLSESCQKWSRLA
jgi:hypothetical protein